MAKATLLNLKGEKVKEIKLNDEIFGIEPNEQTVYDAVKRKGASFVFPLSKPLILYAFCINPELV